jgi:hypothetical protein
MRCCYALNCASIFASNKIINNLKSTIMKKISKLSLMLVMTLLAMNVHAGTVDFTIDVKKEQGKMVTFALNTVDVVNLSIYDAEDKLVHSEKVNSKKDFNRTYDLNALPEGSYFLEVESDSKILRYEISVARETASLSANAISEEDKPAASFLYKDGLVWVNIINPGQFPMYIKIINEYGDEVYNSIKLTNQNVTKVFDVNNIENEKYTFVMTYNDKTITNTFPNK